MTDQNTRARCKVLDWDSTLFGIPVALIPQPRLTAEELAGIIADLKQQRIRLVYWPADGEMDPAVVRPLGGLFVGRKVTLAIDFRLADGGPLALAAKVEPFTDAMSATDLEDLAVQSGAYSRFSLDPHFPREKMVSLYQTWIRRSVRKEIAFEVLVIRDAGKIAAMITLGDKNGRGDIGLLAVDAAYRGRKYGETIVRAAQRCFRARGYESGQVATQAENIAACRLYTKCGYAMEKVEYYYHFWL